MLSINVRNVADTHVIHKSTGRVPAPTFETTIFEVV